MAVVSVSFDGVRLDDSDANTDWDNFPSGGQSPASESNLQYQGASVVNQKLSTQSLDGISYTHPSTSDMTAASRKLFFGKLNVADFGQLDATYGASFSIGLDAGNRRNYNVAGTGAKISRFSAYPAAGGYLIAAINPTVSGWIDNTTGTVSGVTAIDFFGAQGDWLPAAAAKSENFAFDAIDIGDGLTLTAGDGASADGEFPDFVAADQDSPTTGRWGVCFGAGPLVQAQGRLRIGLAVTATEFTDNTSTVLFLDSYVGAGDNLVQVDIGNASTVVNIGCSIGGLGANHTEADTRPDHTVIGTSGTYNFSGTLANHRNVTLTSAVTVDGASMAYADLTQASARIVNSTLIPNSAANVAACNDATFNASTGLSDCNVIQGGLGHAFEIAGDVTLTNMSFSGFGADASSSAALFINVASGTVNVSLVGTSQPTYRLPGGSTATVNFVQNNTLTITGVLSGGILTIFDDETSDGANLNTILQGPTSTTGADVPYSHSFSSNDIVVQFYKSGYEEINVNFALTNAAQSLDLTSLLEPEVNI